MSTEIEIITYQQWDAAVSRAVNAQMKVNHRAMTHSSVCNRTHRYIVEIRDGERTMIVKAGWRQAIKLAAIAT